ncbi:MAG TPA: DNA oxidative demethylase AlkB [Steroidobacteraceae bacterium]|nr:DNA oxidative demethylase AlkB [Steroidobacteraceae bacterium]
MARGRISLKARGRALIAEEAGPGLTYLAGFALPLERALLADIEAITRASPFRHMLTPGGQRMSVAMSNCGEVGWVSDRKGYRYERLDPETGRPWPPLPDSIAEVGARAAAASGFGFFQPDVCLINRYLPGARMSLHQDRDERDFSSPIVSVSLGLTARFLFGGLKRSEKPRHLQLEHGDVVVWGSARRLAYHGVAPLADGSHPLLGRMRLNLTLRKAL